MRCLVVKGWVKIMEGTKNRIFYLFIREVRVVYLFSIQEIYNNYISSICL